MGNSASKRLRAEEQDDPFNRLLDEMMLSQILDKISDAKSLCSISLVSKKFASLVYNTQIVSFKFPFALGVLPQDDHQESKKPTSKSLSWPWKVFHFVAAPLRFVRGFFLGPQEMQQTSPLMLSSSKGFDILGHLNFLSKLKSMRSLHVELVDFFRDDSMMVKWKLDCSRPASFVMLQAYKLDESPSPTDDDGDHDYLAPDDVDMEAFELLISNYFLKHACAWFDFVKSIVPSLPESLQNVVVTDSKNRGRVVLGGDELVGVRTKNATFLLRDTILRYWRASAVKLPSSGSVMEMVILLICKDSETGKNIDDYSIVAETFQEEEERIYFEAATELMNKEAKFFLEVPVARVF